MKELWLCLLAFGMLGITEAAMLSGNTAENDFELDLQNLNDEDSGKQFVFSSSGGILDYLFNKTATFSLIGTSTEEIPDTYDAFVAMATSLAGITGFLSLFLVPLQIANQVLAIVSLGMLIAYAVEYDSFVPTEIIARISNGFHHHHDEVVHDLSSYSSYDYSSALDTARSFASSSEGHNLGFALLNVAKKWLFSEV